MRNRFHRALPLGIAATLLASAACTQDPNDGIVADDRIGRDARDSELAAADQARDRLDADRPAGSTASVMSAEAAEQFRNEQSSFSLDASAGLTIVDFSARADLAAGGGDIIVWTDTAGAFAGATIGINGVSYDGDATAAFYGPSTDTRAVLSGELLTDRARQLRDALTG